MITPIRITTNNSLLGVGTGKDKGEEVFPTTSYTLRYFKLSPIDIVMLKEKQQKRLDTLPDYESVNNLREYQKEDVKYQSQVGHPTCGLVEQAHIEENEYERQEERQQTCVDRLLTE